MEKKTLTAPIALIKMQIGGELKTVGKIRNIRVTETFRRQPIKGIGTILPSERPIIDWDGTFSCQSFTVDLHSAGMAAAINRKSTDANKFVNTLLLNERGVDIYIYRKVANAIDANTGIVETVLSEPIAPIRKCHPERQSFDITDGQVSGTDMDFSYDEPILFDPADLK